MKLIDANLLIYAIDESFADARPWLEEAIGGRETVALPWVVLLSFLRLTTKARVMTSPFAVDEALARIHRFANFGGSGLRLRRR